MTEEIAREHKPGSVERVQYEQEGRKESKKIRVSGTGGLLSGDLTFMNEGPRRRESMMQKKIFGERMTEISSNSVKYTNLQIQCETKKFILRHIGIKLLKPKDKE